MSGPRTISKVLAVTYEQPPVPGRVGYRANGADQVLRVACRLLWAVAITGVAVPVTAAERTRLPADVWPVIGCWFWHDGEFQPGGYRPFLDDVARQATYNLLTTSIRSPGQEVTSSEVHAQIRRAAAYARDRAMGVVMDLDVRLARTTFQEQYPDELQEMLRVREVALADTGQASLEIPSTDLSDHYTFRADHYVPLAGRLVRVYAYRREADGIDPASIRDITAEACQVREASAQRVRVDIACSAQTRGCQAAALVAFTHFTPDVFAPHLLAYQRRIIADYADAQLAGACKDEWGFPPCFDGNPAHDDYWFSSAMAAAYADRTGGRDLVRDVLLMCFGQRGQQGPRQAVINHFMALGCERNATIEADFYRAVKDTFGTAAVVATHPTWWPYPDSREFKKNGLDWWAAPRDLAQVDEITPFCVRTALAKKWNSPLWYNMFYAAEITAYEKSVWTHALGGGRINYHPVYPADEPLGWRYQVLLGDDLARGDARVRLLNFVSSAPLECPVAVIFGHAGAMNWAGPAYNDVGMELTNRLWQSGYYADLIPSTELASGALEVADDGAVCYGRQRYAAAVLYHPEFESPTTADFFQRAAQGPTRLWRVGDWTTDFDGQPYAGNRSLPAGMSVAASAEQCAAQVVASLGNLGIPRQQPATERIGWGAEQSAAPPATGECRLLDGTHLLVAGSQDVTGDRIDARLDVNGHQVEIAARGVAAVRLAGDGQLLALAAGELRRFHTESLTLALAQPVDVALWQDVRGNWQGVVQDLEGPIPPPLAAITAHWLRLALPSPRSSTQAP